MNNLNEKKPKLCDPPWSIKLDDDSDQSVESSVSQKQVLLDHLSTPSPPVSSQQTKHEVIKTTINSPTDDHNQPPNMDVVQPYPNQPPNMNVVQPYPNQPPNMNVVQPYPNQPPNMNVVQPYPNQPPNMPVIPFYPEYAPTMPFTPTSFMDVSLSVNDMQALKKEACKAEIEIHKKAMILYMELEKQRMDNNEKIRHQKELDTYNDQRTSAVVSNIIYPNIPSTDNTNHITVKSIVQGFITDRATVRVRSLGKGTQEFQILSLEENRHRFISLQNLSLEISSYIEEILPEGATPSQTFINRCFALLRTSIPKLNKSNLITLEPYQVLFMNGYLDLLTWKFKALSELERKKYYTDFSFDLNYPNHFEEPIAFNALLQDSLNSDENAITLFWEQAGAIFTPIATLKKVFAFQGAPNSGKTRISNIISACMPYEDTLIISNLAPISDDNLISIPIRLIQVQELGKSKIAAKQIVKLKAYADGSRYPGASSFKILLNTNYAIKTSDDGTLEPALKNRLSVLPFPRPMQNSNPYVASFEDVYFEKERPFIILKALRAFSDVIRNNYRFSYEFEPNIYVFDENTQQNYYQPDNIDFTSKPPLKPSRQAQFENLMNRLFTPGEHIDPNMTVRHIMSIVNHYIPNEFKDEASAGKRIREFFGNEHLKSKRNSEGITCYNLVFQN